MLLLICRSFPSNGSLVFENFGLSDEGAYQCVVCIVDKNQFTWIFLSKRAILRFHLLSRFAFYCYLNCTYMITLCGTFVYICMYIYGYYIYFNLFFENADL